MDDVNITGTHERKLQSIMRERNILNQVIFTYFARYTGSDASIESRLNFAAIQSLQDYIDLLKEDSTSMIIRPMKYLLGQSSDALECVLGSIPGAKLRALYHGILAEGYYRLPNYQRNIDAINTEYHKRFT